MTAFTSLDQVLQGAALTPAPSREVAPAPSEFQPLFSPTALAASAGREVAAPALHGEPQIEVIQQDGRVQQIVVTCRCGERTVLECAY